MRSDPASVLDDIDRRWAGERLSRVVDAVVAELPAGRELRLLDCGGDLGHLLAAGRAARGSLDAVYVSASPSAIVRAMKRSGAAGLLADPAREWPVRDGAADVVLCAFAEHRPAEFHRVLTPGGVVVFVAAEADVAALDDDVYPWFEHDQTRTVPAAEGVVSVVRYRRRRRPLSW
ncbi:class I SAM-dependent methyltransferase [Naasia sp. SYSU D00057]|uniref:class I SAM-dependent methyltransferase n=1 Tax=Naasia sp. SYSU D00057 TaxID=2817380 RepID=UPI001B3105F7|nr:class I SAM-dependent methyltransferase [Naasia sp. SYSU D00057]